VDVAFGEQVEGSALIEARDLLSFAEIRPASLPVVALEQHIVEKLHAYGSTYSRGRPSSRIEDLVDWS
jgi:hypothetical protein